MKTLNKFKVGAVGVWMSLFLVFAAFSTQKAKANPIVNIDFQVFYENLAPYGTWINDAQYGYIWAPDVDNNFRPYYTNGHWVNTEYGNMWISNYSWGWAPFHYGRWTLNNRYGWVWVPGYEWGPSWVTWRQGGGYYGWAPMAPGVSINVSFSSGYHVPNHYWTFVPYRNIYSTRLYSYHSVRRAPRIINKTTVINNTYINNDISYVSGPSRSDIRRTTGQEVKTYAVSRNNRSARTQVDGDRVNLYQPETSRSTANTATRRSVQAAKTEGSSASQSSTNTATRRSAATNRTNSPQSNENSTPANATRSSARSSSVQKSNEPAPANAATRRSTSVKENSSSTTTPTATRRTTTSTPSATQTTTTQKSRSTPTPASRNNTSTTTRSARSANTKATATPSSRSSAQKSTRTTTNNRSSNTSASRRR